ncbi:MAG TPA: MBL fold metallo-hydrolase [Baekduia sp.]|uniref:MBL fold metallo-hydrolase n=1 Tax=Baekduia sp. TaxID=2600305 RepID=UPI002BA5F4CB|nr:MBL fold metallo-hydrolase [Baekduia sp.]HMJ36962.1 MBL fold metallo-hydrolase [Baekduia sp.]
MSGATTDDAQALRALESVPLALPPGLEIAWLGVSGYRLSYQGVTVFIDPYVSRVPLRSLLLRRTAMPDEALIDRYATASGEVAGVLVGHTHFDHAVDAPAIARRHGAKAYGSASLGHLMRLHGLGGLAVEVTPHQPYELGPFVVRFVPSRHSKLLFGRKVPMDGELTCDHLDGLAPGAYRCGAVYGIRIEVAGIALYHQGSADLDDTELPREPVDVFLAGVAGRSFTPRYWERILPRLDPRVIVPTHYDNFFSPLGRPQDFVKRVDLAGLPGEVAAVAGDTRLAALPRVDAP